MKTIKLLFISLLLGLGNLNMANAQLFTDINAALTGTYLGGINWVDIDNDNDLDCFVSGWAEGASGLFTGIYKNNGNSTFTLLAGTGIIPVGATASAWGDYNGDGWIDLALCGNTQVASSIYYTKIYKNNGNNTFSNTVTLPDSIALGSIKWIDMDNDGDLDLSVLGLISGSNAKTQIYKNQGNDIFEPITNPIPDLTNGEIAWGDYDNDLDMDLLICGRISSFNYTTQLFKNNGNETLSNSNVAIEGLRYSSVAWADFNQDGLIDFINTGSNNSDILKSIIYMNTGNPNTDSTFININANITPINQGRARWGDFDNDGDADLIIAGNDTITGAHYITKIYENNNNNFIEFTPQNITSVRRSYIDIGDFNNDSKIDLAINGYAGYQTYISEIYSNNTAAANTPPTAPPIITEVAAGDSVIFSWTPSTDAQTASAGLTYNIRVGVTPNGQEIMNCNANLSNGFLKVPQMGNAGTNTSWKLKNLPEAIYFWSVQAIDNSFAGSEFSESSMFTIGSPQAPSVNLGDDTAICQGQSVILDAGYQLGNQYVWKKIGSNDTLATSQYLTVNASGEYYVMAYNFLGNDNDTIAVTVNTIPTTPIITNNLDTLFSDAPTGNQWYNDSGMISGATSPVYIATTSSNYYTIVTLNNCASAPSNTITINIGINQIQKNDHIQIHPNPANNCLTISTTKAATIQINNAAGQQVLSQSINGIKNIDISKLPEGIYFITTNKDWTKAKKIIIKR